MARLLFGTAVMAVLILFAAKLYAREPEHAVSGDRAGRLERYYFHEDYYAGSLRSEVPLPVYDTDPEHLWNRLFAAFSIRTLKLGRWSPSGLPRMRVDEWMPPELSPKLKEVWWRTYNRETQGRIEGGDVVELPLFARPESLTSDRYFLPANVLLDEFLRTHGERMIEDPLKRTCLLRDLWQVFDTLQRISESRPAASRHSPTQAIDSPNPNLMKSRQRELSRKIAAVMRAIALTNKEVAALPDTFEMAINSGLFAATHDYDRSRPYLPLQLLDGTGEWLEIQNERKGLLAHTDYLGFEGRAWFRVFYRFPEAAGGRQALKRFLSEPDHFRRDEYNRLTGPDVPPGTEVALVRMMMTIDRAGEIHPTKLVEDLQLLVLRYVDGALHPDTDSGRGQNFYQYELSRAA